MPSNEISIVYSLCHLILTVYSIIEWYNSHFTLGKLRHKESGNLHKLQSGGIGIGINPGSLTPESILVTTMLDLTNACTNV